MQSTLCFIVFVAQRINFLLKNKNLTGGKTDGVKRFAANLRSAFSLLVFQFGDVWTLRLQLQVSRRGRLFVPFALNRFLELLWCQTVSDVRVGQKRAKLLPEALNLLNDVKFNLFLMQLLLWILLSRRKLTVNKWGFSALWWWFPSFSTGWVYRFNSEQPGLLEREQNFMNASCSSRFLLLLTDDLVALTEFFSFQLSRKNSLFWWWEWPTRRFPFVSTSWWHVAVCVSRTSLRGSSRFTSAARRLAEGKFWSMVSLSALNGPRVGRLSCSETATLRNMCLCWTTRAINCTSVLLKLQKTNKLSQIKKVNVYTCFPPPSICLYFYQFESRTERSVVSVNSPVSACKCECIFTECWWIKTTFQTNPPSGCLFKPPTSTTA